MSDCSQRSTAPLPLDLVTSLWPAVVLEGADIDEAAGRTPVRVTAELDGDRISKIGIWGADIQAALDDAGASIPELPPDRIVHYDAHVHFDEGEPGMEVTAPPAAEIAPDSDTGCAALA